MLRWELGIVIRNLLLAMHWEIRDHLKPDVLPIPVTFESQREDKVLSLLQIFHNPELLDTVLHHPNCLFLIWVSAIASLTFFCA